MVILLSSVHGPQELEGRVIRHIFAVRYGGSDIVLFGALLSVFFISNMAMIGSLDADI